MKKLIVILTAVSVVFVNAAFAQEPSVMMSEKPGWHKIGEVKANFKMENESIIVLGEDIFKSILLKVTDAPINIEKVEVFYETGESENIEVRNEIKAGGETRVIDLKHPDKEISKITFTYKTLPNRKDEKAHVELYGFMK